MIVGIVYKLDFDIDRNPCFDIDIVSEALFEVDGVKETNTTGAQTSFDITVGYNVDLYDLYTEDLEEIERDLKAKLNEGLDRCFRGVEFILDGNWYTVEHIPPHPPTHLNPWFRARQNDNPLRTLSTSRVFLVESIQETREEV